jgi:invasion protein IalB
MRNTLIGGALAAVLVAALFWASQSLHEPSVAGQQTAAAIPPAQAAASLTPKFVGEKKIGSWILVCGDVHELPKPPPMGGHVSGNSQGSAPRAAPPPPGWHIPRCHAVYVVHEANGNAEKVRFTFREAGFKRVLALFLRFPPTDSGMSGSITLQIDGNTMQFPQPACVKVYCLSIESIKFADLPNLLKARKISLKYTLPGTQEIVEIPLPVDGLADALNAMRRIDL